MNKRKLPDLFYNPISMVGAAVALVTFITILVLMVIDTLWGSLPAYYGLVTYILLPSVLILGVITVPVGALIERKHWREAAKAGIPPLPRIDLNDGRQRRAFFLFSTGALLLMIFSAIGGYKAFEFTESPTFCGTVCHRVMNPEYTTYQHSPHARIACVECHVGPGASWYVKSKLAGAYQVYAVLFNKYPRPIPAPIKNLRPARETCEQCHWPQAFVGERRVTKAFFLEDSANTRWDIDMLIRIGKSTSGEPYRPAVHWHVDHTVQFLATDSTSQNIPWVRVVDANGKTETFTTSDNPFTPDSVKQLNVKTMDCMDCHNRPTHIIKTPGDAINDAMATGAIDTTIPWIKQTAVNALTPRYTNTKDALDSIAIAINSFYKDKYPTFAAEKGADIKQAIASVQGIYRDNFFPYMHVDWRAYADDIGHTNSLGCFRCHDGSHKSADGQVIPHSCNTCHIILGQGEKPETNVSLGGIDFQHPPAGIGDSWKDGLCTDCHDGTQ
ncbi:MAG: NapC/NirT family cytochrome c [Bacteroidetes bacterium]|nr:NapC/NirT family cytochrome c [Bacteroidota bacterium]MCL5268653.1 NapC/NirT family cytochrome c [Bacteroidota bacterium]